MPRASEAVEADATLNEVRLRGRVSAPPEERRLPSGDVVLLVRLVVPRARRRSAGDNERTRVDTLDCAVWKADLRRRVAGWQPGDQVEVTGSLHRRFWRSGAGVASRYEIEAAGLRRLGRAS